LEAAFATDAMACEFIYLICFCGRSHDLQRAKKNSLVPAWGHLFRPGMS
jgi:hypothetical protein